MSGIDITSPVYTWGKSEFQLWLNMRDRNDIQMMDAVRDGESISEVADYYEYPVEYVTWLVENDKR